MLMDGQEKSSVERLLSRIKNPSFEIRVPQIVLGEAISKILAKDDVNKSEDILLKLVHILQKYKIDAKTCLPPPQRNSLSIMAELSKEDEMLDITDVVILAHALADPDSKFFFTMDQKLIYGVKIKEYERRLRDNEKRNTELKIADRLR